MQIVSFEDNLHEMSTAIFMGKIMKIVQMSAADFFFLTGITVLVLLYKRANKQKNRVKILMQMLTKFLWS